MQDAHSEKWEGEEGGELVENKIQSNFIYDDTYPYH